ncbi:IclR family transcriptional regulator [Lacticaseibacillus daqingensis]|uniref:IclR family transcriptional regulator n=1 Tax=Lacticaseibacillus daqingensis TaxID=2486014 RepID=UPI000F784E21|nr:IclR family transcriptional regulator [Lacticaseibacillus daqingensis]
MESTDLDVKPYGTVLVKAKEIMDFLFTYPTPPTLAEISTGLSASKPTTLKILTTMDMLGLVRRDEQTKQYYLGTQLIAYAQKAIDSFDIAGIAQPYLHELRDATGETINLGIVRNEQIILIDKLESPTSIKLQSTIGGGMHMYSSAMGKAVLATYTPEHLAAYLNTHPLTPVTPHTLVEDEALRINLAHIRQTGVSKDNEENETEVFCLGATLQKNGRLYGAFSISTPKYRLPKARQAKFEKLLLATQTAIQAAL